jgi:hypothetical protein
MLLVHDRDGFCLIDPLGVMLASASDLPSLLDALDGGIAEATRHQADHATPGFAAEPSPRFRVSVAA